MNIRKIINFPINGALIIQAILCLMMGAFFLSESYRREIQNYGNTSSSTVQFSINSLSKDKTNATSDFLLNAPGTLIRQAPQSNGNGNDSLNVQIGGNVDNAPTLKFLGSTIIDSSDLHNLLESKNDNVTIGTSISSENTIKEIPTPLFGTSIYFSKISTSFEDTLLGNYRLIGLTSEQQSKFLIDLSKVSGIQKDNLLSAKTGYTMDNGLVGILIGIGLLITMLILGILIVSYTLSSVKEIGSLTLLGWGKLQLLKHLFIPIFSLSLYLIPVSMIVSLFFYSFNLSILRYSMTASMLNTFILLIILAVSSFIVLAIKPLNAIKGILPKKMLYSFIIFLYLLSSIGLLSVSYALDGPIQQVSQNKRLLNAWSNVENYETLKGVTTGENQTSIAGLSDQLDHEMFNWYQSIENNPGVYYITSQYYDKSLLTSIQDSTNTPTPNNPFTLLTTSPSYIKDHIKNVPKGSIENAEKGARIFLIPSHWSDKKREIFKNWLSETVLEELSGTSFENNFSKNKTIKFIKYKATSDIFTWSTQKGEPTFTKDAVFSIVTTNNMTPFDAGNLRANVLTGPLKFKNKKTMKVSTKYLSNYHLDDNELRFTPVKTFVDGLQKNLLQTITFFGIVISFIILMIMLVLLSMALIFSIINERTIFVKQTLGFSSKKIYTNVILFVLITGLIELCISLLVKSKLGIILIPLVVLLQLITIHLFIKKHSIQKIKGY